MPEMHLKIEIISDFVCPWCFIGERRMKMAVSQIKAEHPRLKVEWHWLPYFLNLDTPPEGEPYLEFMEAKFGSRAAVETMQGRVAAAGQESGIGFSFARIAKRPNTLRAHRLIHRAQTSGWSSEETQRLVNRIFSGYFQHGENIGDIGVLAGMAMKCAAARGEALEDILTYLVGDAGASEVFASYEKVCEWGVSGVPFFVLAESTGVAGAQSVEFMASAIRKALEGES